MFSQKKSFFKKKIKQVERATWDLEFKLFKVREMREDTRRQIDRAKEAIDALEAQLLKENTAETKEALEAKKKEQNTYIENMVKQIELLDARVNGLGTKEFAAFSDEKKNWVAQQLEPSEYSGLLAQIEAGRELMKMYEDYISREI